MPGRHSRAKSLAMGATGALLLAGLLSLAGREAGHRPVLAGQALESRGLELAVSAYEASSHAWEIQRVDMDGRRFRIAPHPPLPLDGAWSPDGRRIAFSGRAVPSHWLADPFSRRYFAAEDHQGLYTTTSAGGDVRLLHPAAACCPSWSPDGRTVAFVGDGAIWLVGADGKGARRVVTLGEANLGIDGGIAWSADGQRLVFVGLRPVDEWTSDSGIYTVRRDGSGLTRITRAQTRREQDNGNQDVNGPSWAPDGRRIAFVRVSGILYRDSPIATIHLVDADGGERRVALGDCPAWAPDGRRLAFLALDRRTSVVGVGIVRAGGGAPRIVKMRTAGCPAWTADGTRLVFLANRERPYIVDADSGRLREPTVGERRRIRLAPHAGQAWSVDGRFLRVEFRENDQGESWVVRVRTLGGVTATFRQWHDDSPAWSPDGRRLAFVSSAKPAGIYVINADGGKPRRVAAGTQPVWSPDGNWIAFEHGYPEGDGRIFVVAASGGRARPVGVGRDPAWSPDSRWLSLGGGGLYLVRREGGEARSVDNVPACGPWTSVKRSAWSHDGRALAFSYVTQCDDEMGSAEQSALVTRDGRSQETLGYSYRPQWAPDDRGIVYLEDYPTRLVYKTAGTNPLRVGGRVRVLETRSVELFSLSHKFGLVAYTLINGNESQLWLVRLDGSGRRPLLRDGSYIDPTWRP